MVNLEVTPTIAVLVSGVMTGLVTPIVTFMITEYRLARQRRWDMEDRYRLANEASRHLNQVHNDVLGVSADVRDAAAMANQAYEAANSVNEWRNDFTQTLTKKQAEALTILRDNNQVIKDTNQQVHLARSIFLVPAIANAAKAAMGVDTPLLAGQKGEIDGEHTT